MLFSNRLGQEKWVSNDPNYANVSLLLRGEYWQDDSKYQWPVTVTANATISTAQKKFGDSSMLFTSRGYATALGYQNNATAHFGTGDYTIDFWLYANTNLSNHVVVGQGNWTKTIAQNRWFVNYNNFPEWKLLREGNASAFPGSGTVSIPTGQWQHIAYVRTSSQVKVYKDGTLIWTVAGTDATNYGNAGYPLTIGNDYLGTSYDNNHYLSHVRITKMARYTTTFTPPTAASY